MFCNSSSNLLIKTSSAKCRYCKFFLSIPIPKFAPYCLVFQNIFFRLAFKKNFLKLRFYGHKVEAYGLQREFETETCKLKLLFPFVPATLLLYVHGSVVFLNFFIYFFSDIFHPSSATPRKNAKNIIYTCILFFTYLPVLSDTNPLVILKEKQVIR